MKLFIDTANIEDIREAHLLGLIDGVTTNPTLVAKEGKDFMSIIQEICQVVDGPISVEAVSTEYLLHTLEPDYKLIMVGDARMATWELVQKFGAIYYYERNDTPGIVWLKRIADHFDRCVWLNPTTPMYWQHPTVTAIGKLFPMYEFTIEGLGEAVRKLVAKQ